MKRFTKILAVGLLLIIVGAGWAWAEEPADQMIPGRTRIMEILQEHPEVWEEIQAIRAEYETLREQKGRMAFNRPMQRQMRNRFQATDRCDRFPRWTEEDSNEDFQNFPQNFPHQGRKWFR